MERVMLAIYMMVWGFDAWGAICVIQETLTCLLILYLKSMADSSLIINFELIALITYFVITFASGQTPNATVSLDGTAKFVLSA